jgi:hypothetical protein
MRSGVCKEMVSMGSLRIFVVHVEGREEAKSRRRVKLMLSIVINIIRVDHSILYSFALIESDAEATL